MLPLKAQPSVAVEMDTDVCAAHAGVGGVLGLALTLICHDPGTWHPQGASLEGAHGKAPPIFMAT